jgi:hypothetical protein
MEKDIIKFKIEFDKELETEWDFKFKKYFKRVQDDREPRVTKYDNLEEVESIRRTHRKFLEIRENIKKEIKLKKLGLWKEEDPQEKKEELTPMEKQMEEEMRFNYERLYFKKHDFPVSHLIQFDERDSPQVDFRPPIPTPKLQHKNSPANPKRDEIISINKRRQYYNEMTLYSLQKTVGISTERKLEMRKRFLEYFGRYNNLMYPDGFRHYENFEFYNQVFPMKNINDYMTESI